MKKIFGIAVIFLIVGMLSITVAPPPGPVQAAGPTLPTKGTSCFLPNSEPDIQSYTIYRTNPSLTVTTINIGKPAGPPVPPDPSQACASGSIGVIRDQTGQVDGQYSDQITATNTSGKESAKSTTFPFTLSKALNLGPPAVPQNYEDK